MPVLITNHGPHSPEKWADATASMIFPVDPNVEGDRLLAARRVQMKITEALVPHHEKMQSREREHLGGDGDKRMFAPYDGKDHADEAMSGVIDALKGTPWEEKASNEEWLNIVRNLITQHFNDAQHIERSWHAIRNPHNETCRAFTAAYHGPAPQE